MMARQTSRKIIAFVAAAAWATGPAEAVSGLERVLRDADQRMCETWPLTCKKKPAPRKAKPRDAKPAAEKPVEPEPKAAAAPKPVAAPPKPRRKPARPAPVETAAVKAKPEFTPPPVSKSKPEPKEQPVARTTVDPVDPLPIPPAARTTPAEPDCVKALKQLGASIEAFNGSITDGQCRVENAVEMTAFRTGSQLIEFPDRPILACAFALRFAEWIKESAAPIVIAQSKSPIGKLHTGPGYQCRGRNGDITAKISEHGFGNAVDIESFTLADGRRIVVTDAPQPRSAAHDTLQGLRGSACGYFTTVLGPGSNAAHAGHFHLDLGKHGQSGNYRICE